MGPGEDLLQIANIDLEVLSRGAGADGIALVSLAS